MIAIIDYGMRSLRNVAKALQNEVPKKEEGAYNVS